MVMDNVLIGIKKNDLQLHVLSSTMIGGVPK